LLPIVHVLIVQVQNPGLLDLKADLREHIVLDGDVLNVIIFDLYSGFNLDEVPGTITCPLKDVSLD